MDEEKKMDGMDMPADAGDDMPATEGEGAEMPAEGEMGGEDAADAS